MRNCEPTEVARFQTGWLAGAFHLLPGKGRSQHRGRGLVREPCPRAVAALVVRRDSVASSWPSAGAAEPWRPSGLTVGALLDLTPQMDRSP